MSNGWRYCKKCKVYQKWMEYYGSGADSLWCRHNPTEDTDIENYIDFNTDDQYEEYRTEVQKFVKLIYPKEFKLPHGDSIIAGEVVKMSWILGLPSNLFEEIE